MRNEREISVDLIITSMKTKITKRKRKQQQTLGIVRRRKRWSSESMRKEIVYELKIVSLPDAGAAVGFVVTAFIFDKLAHHHIVK